MRRNNVANFGRGWVIIIMCLLIFYFYAGFTTDGTNLSLPAFAEAMGLSVGVTQTFHGIGGYIAVGVMIVICRPILKRLGARRTATVLMIMSAVVCMILPRISWVWLFCILDGFLIAGIAYAAFTCGGILVISFFPRYKGMVMGYTTMGLNIASACWVAIVTFLSNRMGGFKNGILPMCIVAIVVALLLLLVKDTPDEMGIYPDNVSKEIYEKDYVTDINDIENDPFWTPKKLLTNKYFWQVAVITGFFNIATGSLVSNMLARNMEVGMTQNRAIAMMTVIAFVGLFGSWLIGYFDDRFGTKRTMLGFGIFYFVAGIFNFLASFTGMWSIYISVVMIGVGIGGSANFTSSLPGTVFGRRGINNVNSTLFPVQYLFISSLYLIAGFIRIITGDDLKWVFIVGCAFALVAGLLALGIKDQFKYNVDYQKEEEAEKAEAAAKDQAEQGTA